MAVALAAVAALLPAGPASARATLWTVRFSASSVVAGTAVTASIDRDRRPARSTLVLQRRYYDGWKTVDRTATAAGTRWRFTVPTGQYGTFGFRVAALRGGKVVAGSPVRTVRVRPAYTPVGAAAQHAFQRDTRTRRLVRWDPCRPIRWVFNPASSPRDGLAQVREGIRRIRLATGLDLRYAGTTRQKPDPHGAGLRGAEVIVGWRTAADYAPFRGTSAVGRGGNAFYGGWREAGGARVNRAVRGGVVLNASLEPALPGGYGPGFTWGEVILHELAHVVGLDHTPAEEQVMHRQLIDRNADWGAGDLAGLARLGSSRGCLRPPTTR